MNVNRVVVTGLSALSPLGADLETTWTHLLAGHSGIGPITQFDASAYATTIAGEVSDFNPERYIERKQARRMDRFTQFAVAATQMLFENAQWRIPEEEQADVGALLGCGLGGLKTIEEFHTKLMQSGPKRVSPFYIPILISNMAPGQVSITTGAKGPNLVTTSACASGLHGIGYAYTDILLGRAKAMICGGVESTITPMGVSGFNAMKALSTRNDDPTRASRPFDQDRDGFVMAEGCGLLLLESLEHALDRGARIYAEVVGFGASADGYHMTAPKEDGEGMARCMRAALKEAGVRPEEIDHINAHGTSTSLNDLCETRAIKTVFEDRAHSIPITANKSMFGHLLGAAGGIESVVSVKSIDEGVIPGTINLDNPEPECDLDYVTDGTRHQPLQYTLCNSFGFGGTNATMLFKQYDGK
ncbi:MAG: beta-ketoacyl-ACP synthase II [Thermodesulfobacteriota bacterium]